MSKTIKIFTLYLKFKINASEASAKFVDRLRFDLKSCEYLELSQEYFK